MVLERGEWIPGSDLLAVHRDGQSARPTGLAIEIAVEDHAEVVAGSVGELLQTPSRPPPFRAILRKHPIEVFPEHDRSRAVVQPLEAPVDRRVRWWIDDLPPVAPLDVVDVKGLR